MKKIVSKIKGSNLTILDNTGKEQTVEVEDLKRREDMLTGGELLQWIVQFGRWNVQECVAESRDMRDVLTYLRAEMVLEMVKAISFVTADSVWFEKIPSSPPVAKKD